MASDAVRGVNPRIHRSRRGDSPRIHYLKVYYPNWGLGKPLKFAMAEMEEPNFAAKTLLRRGDRYPLAASNQVTDLRNNPTSEMIASEPCHK